MTSSYTPQRLHRLDMKTINKRLFGFEGLDKCGRVGAFVGGHLGVLMVAWRGPRSGDVHGLLHFFRRPERTAIFPGPEQCCRSGPSILTPATAFWRFPAINGRPRLPRCTNSGRADIYTAVILEMAILKRNGHGDLTAVYPYILTCDSEKDKPDNPLIKMKTSI